MLSRFFGRETETVVLSEISDCEDCYQPDKLEETIKKLHVEIAHTVEGPIHGTNEPWKALLNFFKYLDNEIGQARGESQVHRGTIS